MTTRARVAVAVLVLAAFMFGVLIGETEWYGMERYERQEPVVWSSVDSVFHYTERVWDLAWQPGCFLENEALREAAEALTIYVNTGVPDSTRWRYNTRMVPREVVEGWDGLDSLRWLMYRDLDSVK
ncbi:MAG: hypothetical protein OXH49_05845 [Gemmatimonadetes bacterium]|nr:hypothetical protein [Gemmatimonadota bacterium]